MDDKFTMDITPVGMRTQEGVARVSKAVEAYSGAQAVVANKTYFLLNQHFDTIRAVFVRNDEDDAAEELNEIEAAIKEMLAAQDEFMKAVAGR